MGNESSKRNSKIKKKSKSSSKSPKSDNKQNKQISKQNKGVTQKQQSPPKPKHESVPKPKQESEPKQKSVPKQESEPKQESVPKPKQESEAVVKRNDTVEEEKKIEFDSETKNEMKWKLNDPISIFSNSMNEYLPGIIVDIDDEKKEIAIQFWDIQSLEIKYKIQLFDSDQIQKREYNTKHDPWNIQFDKNKLSDDDIKNIKHSLSKNSDIFKQDDIDTLDINEWFVRFKNFVKEKKELRRKNPFIRLISSYLCENIKGWIDIFIKYIFTMIVFQQESNHKNHFHTKLHILFEILNVGSQHIDTESLQIICIMYAKCILSTFDETAGKEKPIDTKEKKKEIAEFAKKLLEKITEQDADIDINDFKQIIANSKEMTDIISQSVNDAILTERNTITPN